MEKNYLSSAVRPALTASSANHVLPRSLAYLPDVASVSMFVIALASFSACLADYPPVALGMNPLSSMGMMLVSAGLWLSSCSPAGPRSSWLGRFFSYLVIALALLKLAHLQFNFSPAP